MTGMEMKAHAEEGLLINEVAAYDSKTWDALATANETPTTVVMRPASSYNLSTWWHANSKRSADEAGIGELDDTVDVDANGNKYVDISPANVSDNNIVTAVQATGNSKAETHIYYKDASFGTAEQYDDGEGFYVMYKYYLKSSGDADLAVKNLQVQVKATKKQGDTGTSTDLEKSLRVGVVMPVSTANGAANSKALIFAPVTGGDSSYSVTTAANGSTSQSVTAVTATTGQFSAFTTLNTATDGSANITIPKVTSDGIPVYVYAWFEGEDQNCMSDNLTDILCTYDIDLNIKDADLEAY